jgi:hypothetical protein
MIANRIRLTPTLRAKLHAQTQAIAKSEEELFLIHLRLRELLMLVPLKLQAIRLIRQRIANHGTTQRLECELAEQREQLQDLSQLSRDWLKSISNTQNNLNSSPYSASLNALLHQLRADFECSTSVTQTNS